MKKKLGVPFPLPGLASFTKTVPASVPSLIHSSSRNQRHQYLFQMNHRRP